MDRYACLCMLSDRMVRPNPYLTCDHHHRSSPAADRSDLPRTTVSFWGVATRDAGFSFITVGVAETLDDPRIDADPYAFLPLLPSRRSIPLLCKANRAATRTPPITSYANSPGRFFSHSSML